MSVQITSENAQVSAEKLQFNSRLKIRHGTASEWSSSKYVLLEGELGVAVDTKVLKVGDGASTWTQLPALSFSGNYSDLSGTPMIPNVPAWALETTKPSYTKAEVGLGNVQNVDTTNAANITSGKLSTDRLTTNTANGILKLDSQGKVPSAQLPSYVDDVESYENRKSFPETGEDGKIYIDKETNKQYRWDGESSYVEISASLALGESASTAYAGNKGKANADAIAALQTRVGSIEAKNTTQDTALDSKYSYSNPPPYPVTSVNGKTGAVNITASSLSLADVATSGDYDDLINQPSIPSVSAWALAASKPSYTWSEIGSKPTWIGNSKPTYSYSEISGTPSIPTNVVQYTKQTLSEDQRAQARTNIGAGTSNFSGAYSELSGAPTIYSWALAASKPSYAYSELTGSVPFIDLPTGTTSSTVAVGNHTHSGYASSSHTHSASNITSGTLAIARIPTGATSSTVALGNHDHEGVYATVDHTHGEYAPLEHTHDGYAATGHTHSASDITTGTLAFARIPTGTSSSTVAIGNHTHSGYASSSHTHTASDITSGTFAIARIPTGSTSSTVALGNHTHTGYATSSHTHTEYAALAGSNVYTGSNQMPTLLIKGSSNYGGKINFGDGNYVYLEEASDDKLTIYADKGLALNTGTSGSVTINGKSMLTEVPAASQTTRGGVKVWVSGTTLHISTS